jgi:hypothetical protein
MDKALDYAQFIREFIRTKFPLQFVGKIKDEE